MYGRLLGTKTKEKGPTVKLLQDLQVICWGPQRAKALSMRYAEDDEESRKALDPISSLKHYSPSNQLGTIFGTQKRPF